MSASIQSKGTIMRDDRISESSGRSVEQLERRARELARIRGAKRNTYRAEDMQRARQELLGEHLPTQDAGAEPKDTGLIRDPSEPPANRGHEVVNLPASDEQSDPEALALEGVDAATREQMLAARRRRDSET